MHNIIETKVPHYLKLMRFDKPIGSLLLLWPTLWALWIVSEGRPSASLFWIFVMGVFVMRSAGCVVNDLADRKIDPLVERTKERPLAAGYIAPTEAVALFVALSIVALCLLYALPSQVWPWAIPAMAVTIGYPFMKRFIQAPQAVLGVAFSFCIPMIYVAMSRDFDLVFLLLVIVNFCWVVAYDTAYAMSDREDDLKIGVKSTAILFGRFDRLAIGVLHLIVMLGLLAIKYQLQLAGHFYFVILVVGSMFAYQHWLIRDREKAPCFQAFLNNGWVGAVIWFGLLSGVS